MPDLKDLFLETIAVVNVGLSGFADDLRKQGVKVIHVDWRPPAGGNKKTQALLDKVKKSQAAFTSGRNQIWP